MQFAAANSLGECKSLYCQKGKIRSHYKIRWNTRVFPKRTTRCEHVRTYTSLVQYVRSNVPVDGRAVKELNVGRRFCWPLSAAGCVCVGWADTLIHPHLLRRQASVACSDTISAAPRSRTFGRIYCAAAGRNWPARLTASTQSSPLELNLKWSSTR